MEQTLTYYVLDYCEEICGIGLVYKYLLSSSLCFLLSFVSASYILPRILLISRKKHLYDTTSSRKSHTGEVPRLGGLAFVPVIICSMSLAVTFRYLIDFPITSIWVIHALMEMLFLISGISILYLVGVKDDLVGVRYRQKFFAQYLVATLIPCSGLYLNNLYGLFGIYDLPVWVGVPLTIVSIVYITNSLNLIDGIDGLAASISSIAFFVFGILFFDTGLYLYSMLALSTLGCVLPFAYYNIFGRVGKTKIFMGDTGSLTLGFLLACMFIRSAKFLYSDYQVHDVNAILIPISVLFIPCFDAFRVMVVRACCRQPLFHPDRRHFHHKCLDAGMTHIEGTGFIILCNIVLICINISMSGIININWIVLLDIILFLLIIHWLDKNKE